uniref:Ig-like domain-containing protein n=1 Tax=Ficedula albicollis TaxID=59894 RepID=A0A803V157_FICAL
RGDLQPPREESLTLLCGASGFDFGNYDKFWMRQSPGNGGDTEHAASARGRFRISRDKGQSSVTLTMNNLKDEDSGAYFCAKSSETANAAVAGYGCSWSAS